MERSSISIRSSSAAWSRSEPAFTGTGIGTFPQGMLKTALCEEVPVLAQRREDPIDVVLDVVEVERDPQARVARRGDDVLRRERVHERVGIGRDDTDQRAVLLLPAR